MIGSTPRYEGVDSINIHDGSMYALSTHPALENPARLNFTPTQEPLHVLALLSAKSHCVLWLRVCVNVQMYEPRPCRPGQT